MPFSELSNILSKIDWPYYITCPSWKDLQKGGLPRDNEMVDNIVNLLQKGVVFIVGPSNWGKTFLAYMIGCSVEESNPPDITKVFYAEAKELQVTEAEQEVENRRQLLRRLTLGPQIRFLFIVEDCHLNSDLVERLMYKASPPSLTFLFTQRGTSEDDLIHAAQEVYQSTPHHIIFLASLPPHRRNSFSLAIAKAFIQRTKQNRQQRGVQPCPDVPEQELVEFVQSVGADLHRLVICLRAWERNCQRVALSKVDEHTILLFTSQEFDITPIALVRCKALKVLSVLGKYGVSVPGDFLIALGLEGALESLVNQKLVTQRMRNGAHYSLWDVKNCEWVTKALIKFGPQSGMPTESDIVTQFATQVPDSAFLLLNGLGSAKAKKEIHAILQHPEALSFARYSLRGRSSTALRRTLYELTLALPKKERSAIALLVTAEAREALMSDLRGAPAYRIRQSLPVLRWVMNLHDIFKGWTTEDWRNTINRSLVNTLRLLCYDFRNWMLPEAVEALGQQLPYADLEKLLDPARVELGERGLNGLIGNLKQDAPSTVPPFLRRIAERNLGDLLKKAKPEDAQWLLWQMLVLGGYDVARRFVEVNQQNLSSVLLDSHMPAQFWLLWNVYQADPSLATSWVQAFNLFDPLPTQDDPLYLPSLGLLTLCKRRLPSLPLLQDRDVANRINSEEDPALLGLSLEALMYTLPSPRCVALRETIDLQRISEKLKAFPVPMTRNLLLEVLRRFQHLA